jgi:type I restriction enzyme, S subunit
LERYQLAPGDLLFNRTNSKELVGKCAVFEEEGTWVFASYLIRVRLDRTEAAPHFVAAFLNSDAGRLQIDRLSRRIIGMSNVNAEEIRTLQIPLPPLTRQKELTDRLSEARKVRDEQLRKRLALFDQFDKQLLLDLGLEPEPYGDVFAYATRRSDLVSGSRLNAEYFHPERVSVIRRLESGLASGLKAKSLSSLVDFIRRTSKATIGPRFIGLADVESGTGELVGGQSEAAGQAFQFQAGDVLFARLRPYLNKVHLAEATGVCSTEFHVLRKRNQGGVAPEYLAALLRSPIVLVQTRHIMTGNTLPRLTTEDAKDLLIPVASLEMQTRIQSRFSEIGEQARSLRDQADATWFQARRDFERALFRE